MKNIKLIKGFLVNSWDGLIEEIQYFKTDYLQYGNVEEKFIMFKNNQMLEPITKYNSNKVFDIESDAVEYSKQIKKERLLYFEKQIKHYQEEIIKLK